GRRGRGAPGAIPTHRHGVLPGGLAHAPDADGEVSRAARGRPGVVHARRRGAPVFDPGVDRGMKGGKPPDDVRPGPPAGPLREPASPVIRRYQRSNVFPTLTKTRAYPRPGSCVRCPRVALRSVSVLPLSVRQTPQRGPSDFEPAGTAPPVTVTGGGRFGF